MGASGRLRRVTTRSADQGLRGRRRKLEIEEPARLGDVECLEYLGLTGGGGRPLGHPSFGRLHGDEMHAVELVADVAPGVAGAVFDDPYEEQSEPAELDVASDPVLPMMEDGTESERSLHVPPAPLHFEQLLVGEGEIGGGETVVAGAQQPLAVQLRLSGTVSYTHLRAHETGRNL